VPAQAVRLAERCGARPLQRSLPAGIGKEVPYAEPAGHADLPIKLHPVARTA
jgi:hypothetical protein